MAQITVVTSPLLQSSAQLYILPVSTDGSVSDPLLNRCKTLFNDNYQKYRQACIDGSLTVGTALLVKRSLEHAGLGVNTTVNRPTYIANLVITDHATHPIHQRSLAHALDDLYPQLYHLIRYDGLRRIAFLARPLIHHASSLARSRYAIDSIAANKQTSALNDPILAWQNDVYPLIKTKLEGLPKTRIDIHLPKSSIEHLSMV